MVCVASPRRTRSEPFCVWPGRVSFTEPFFTGAESLVCNSKRPLALDGFQNER